MMSNNTNPSNTEDNSTANNYSLQANSFINNQGPVRVGLFFEDSLPFEITSPDRKENNSHCSSIPLEQNSSLSDNESENGQDKPETIDERFLDLNSILFEETGNYRASAARSLHQDLQ